MRALQSVPSIPNTTSPPLAKCGAMHGGGRHHLAGDPARQACTGLAGQMSDVPADDRQAGGPPLR